MSTTPADRPRPTNTRELAAAIGLRFACIYLVVFNLPSLFEVVPGAGEWAYDLWSSLWDPLVPWVGAHVLRLAEPITVWPNGSGDTTYNWVQVLCFLALSAAGALTWTLVARERTTPRLAAWLRLWVRYALAAAMLLYGGAKVIPSQFMAPTVDRLLQPFGDATPMGLLWTFMDASTSYTVFGGLAEMVGGLLVGLRRTATLGALVCTAVLANVVMLNLAYDVPVKLYSLHLLAMALLLVAADRRRLLDFFVLHRPVQPAAAVELFVRPVARRIAHACGVLVLAYLAGFSLLDSHRSRREYQRMSAEQPWRGVWIVEEHSVDGMPTPPSEPRRWQRVIIDAPGVVAVQLTGGSRERFRLASDEAMAQLSLRGFYDRSARAELAVEQARTESMIWNGTLDGQAVRVALRRGPNPTFRLTSHRLHWVSEYPSNR